MDQAQSLRNLTSRPKPKAGPAEPLRTITVTSGKGGVGKTNLVVNLAIELARLGRKVMVIDADLGLANVDVLLGLNPQFTVNDVLRGDKSIQDVLVKGPEGISILPAASGVSEMTNLSGEEKLCLLQELDELATDADLVLIDTAAGISDTVLYFNIAAQDRIVVATGEPTSLTDAYALIKVLYTQHEERRFLLTVNNVKDAGEAKTVYRKLSMACDRFLQGEISLDYLGFIPNDRAVNQAVMRQTPLVSAFPHSPAARSIRELAVSLLNLPFPPSGGNIKFFWRRLIDMA